MDRKNKSSLCEGAIKMKSHTFILICLASAVFAATASAQLSLWEPLTGDPVPLSSLKGGSLIFGDKMLSDINLFGSASGGAIVPDTNSIFVQGGLNNITGDYGLRFNLSWNAFPNQTVNATLSFKVSVRDGYDNYIKDVGLDITGVSANGTGGVNLGESVRDLNDSPLALLFCTVYPDSPPEDAVDYEEFRPVKAIWIHSKDISCTGGTDGSAHISEFYQYYSQVPEPATITLFGTAGFWLLTRKNKSK